MPDYEDIFTHHADDYQRLVAREDRQNNLLKEIHLLHPLSPDTVAADLGAGTGRVSFILAGSVGRVYAVEPSAAMRGEALVVKTARGIRNVDIMEGKNEAVPLADASVDLTVEGWSFAYVLTRNRPRWQEAADRMVREARRITRPGGTVVLIETLGTMKEEPDAPAGLLAFYDYMEPAHGFQRRWIRTDYRFDSPEEAAELVEFFFGPEMGAEARERKSPIVPECTGVWHLTV